MKRTRKTNIKTVHYVLSCLLHDKFYKIKFKISISLFYREYGTGLINILKNILKNACLS